ncbi:hypothetical protein [Maledivibacter halophilus]|uniref:Uncharacterized protein n=1 Tax=Maledivibacter halophilus TaxID=36842 RepID=A0A1T5L9I0_9FIRM|nr:hypothetical protein [Maledivibacter halophilus]SKC72335.1 hypothetical protein SAMN02194393_02606 [Maledivibacter halophilus]
MSKETKIILDELNFSIGRITEREIKGKRLKESEYWYRQGLKTARDIVLKVENLNKGKS